MIVMNEYLDCKCGSKKTYISVSGDICCTPCFFPLTEKLIEKIDMTARVFSDDGGWSVKVDGVVKKYFSKYEDFACTDANKYLIKLNLEMQ
jgi:hypothetical protein